MHVSVLVHFKELMSDKDTRGIVSPCLTSLGLVESVHGHHSTKLIGHLPLINLYEPTFNVAGTNRDMWDPR